MPLVDAPVINLLDLPHALLEHISISAELTLPDLGCYARVCSLLRQLLAVDAAPCWRTHLDACKVASDQPREALRALTLLDCARWADVTPRFFESAGASVADMKFWDEQPNPQVAHAAFICNDGKTMVMVGAMPGASRLSAWVVDITGQQAGWQEAVAETVDHRSRPVRVRPTARSFSADGGGGGVLRDKAGSEWLCLFGGLVVDYRGQAQYRCNETWLLGPLGAAAGCAEWQWLEVQADGEAESDGRPTPRFHHSQTVVRSERWPRQIRTDGLVICGGSVYQMDPLLEVASLSLHHHDLAPSADGVPVPPPALSEVAWEFVAELEGEPEGVEPEPLERHAAASWDWHGLFVVGGEDSDANYLRTVWLLRTLGLYNLATTWVPLPDLPHERTRAAAVVVHEQLVVCGGHGQGDPSAVWVLSLLPLIEFGNAAIGNAATLGMCWSELSLRQGLESPRLDATLCVAHGDILVLGGGHNGEKLDQFGDAKGSLSMYTPPHVGNTIRLASLGPALFDPSFSTQVPFGPKARRARGACNQESQAA